MRKSLGATLQSLQEAQDIYRELRTVFRDLEPIATPKPLSQLAKMTRFKLYVTTTFDLMAERAIDEERFSGQRQTLVFSYAPNDKQDLPREFNRLNRPAVFHLMGTAFGHPGKLRRDAGGYTRVRQLSRCQGRGFSPFSVRQAALQQSSNNRKSSRRLARSFLRPQHQGADVTSKR